MARIRTIKPEYWTDEKVGALPREVRLTFLGIISAMADDAGRCKANPRLVRAAVYPLDDDISAEDIALQIGQLAGSGVIRLYSVAGEQYIQIINWKRHQKIDKPSASRHPEPPELTPSLSIERTVGESSTSTSRTLATEGSGEGEVKEHRKGSGEDAPPRVVLPARAEDFLNLFYMARSEKERERYRDVKRQLYDVLDPQHPGPKIRGGTRVKARSVEHLIDTLDAVMKDPPPDRDLAIIWLLKKLTNPVPGPTVTEKIKENEAAARAVEDHYFVAAKQAGVKWANENPDEYQKILASVEASYKDKRGSFIQAAKNAELTQRCAQAAAFPTFEVWREQRGAAA